jgi:AraC-like DNA-binding protein
LLAAFEHVVPTHPLTWKMTSIIEPQFESVWHFHPEFELTYIRAGHGSRLVGDSVSDYVPGQLTLIGPDVPHTYVSTPGDTNHAAVVMQFKRDFLGEGFFDIPTFQEVSNLLDAASRGVSFDVDGAEIEQIERREPAERTLGLLHLLLGLSRQHILQLASEQDTPALNRASALRIESMVGRMHADFADELSLADIAASAHLTPSSASRLFSKSTGSSVTIYLNVIRVNAACRLLRDTDRKISSIAVECGFANLSNFNRRFRDVKRLTPREYRASFVLKDPRSSRSGHPTPLHDNVEILIPPPAPSNS